MDQVVDYLREVVVELNLLELSKCELRHFHPARLNNSIHSLSENLVERMYFFHSVLILTRRPWIAAPVTALAPVATSTPIATFTFAGPSTTFWSSTTPRSPGSPWSNNTSNDCSSSRITTLTLLVLTITLTAWIIFFLFIVFSHLTIIFHIK